ncbi:MAG: DNA mismatch repair endonuclease MutL [Deltaproteobacteria bacterium]|nr:DNA mismatch repair endonuclease MutL [Deltaproteobacteria bacterium]
MTSRIKLLPENLINRIAAGEVVERPASILKELIENSLDAGATRVEIETINGGKSLLRVTDNGCGMNKEELFLCLERHATSKLSLDSDLVEIHTLGFRGEALPSIASVSRISITSSPGETGEGHRISIAGGKILGLAPHPANQGTSVEVTDIFFNVPARRKFLKTNATEDAHLLDIAGRYALSRADLSIKLISDGRIVLQAEAQNDYFARVAKILGKTVLDFLVPFHSEAPHLKLRGYVARPPETRRTNANIYIFVSKRPVRDRLLTRALTQGFGRALPQGRYPVGILFVDIEPSFVDVNVHPAKTEVRFRDPGKVFAAVEKTIFQAVTQTPFGENHPTPFSEEDLLQVSDTPADHFSDTPAEPLSEMPSSSLPDSLPDTLPPETNSRPVSPILKGSVIVGAKPTDSLNHKAPLPQDTLRAKSQNTPNFSLESPFEPGELDYGIPNISPDEPLQENLEPLEQPEKTNSLPLRESQESTLKPLAQLKLTYILAEGPDGLYIIDQHAAHERIIFNRLNEELKTHGLPCLRPLFPDTLELTPYEIVALDKLSKPLKHLGFILEPFGESTYVLKGVPSLLDQTLALEALREILDSAQANIKFLDGAGFLGTLTEISESWLHSIACRAAVKAGHPLNFEEMEYLLKDMAEAISGGFCPHGRPSVIKLTLTELERKFGRS